MAKIMIFAGTTEGRLLTEALDRWLAEKAAQEKVSGERTFKKDEALEVFVSVATEYGRDVLEDAVLKKSAYSGGSQMKVLSGRLSPQDMAELFERERFDWVIDTTHPYALAVTEIIRRQCEEARIPCLRVLREKSETEDGQVVYVKSSREAAEYLNSTKGIVFLTTGSKELAAFNQAEGFPERFFARVLPMPGVVEHCLKLGFSGRQLICMQGPFSREMNKALFKQTKAAYLVTKDSGRTGGFDEKMSVALELGMTPVVIGRSPSDAGVSLEEAAALLNERLGIGLELSQDRGIQGGSAQGRSSLADDESAEGENETKEGDWFPLFINIKGKKVVVAGGGKIAKRRIRNLMKFSAQVTVVAREPASQVRQFAESGRLTLVERPWRMEDLAGADCVIAATNDRQVNRAIYEECKKRGILVNVADRKEECDFYFPGVVRRGDLTVGITAEGKNHSLAKKAKEAVEEAVEKL